VHYSKEHPGTSEDLDKESSGHHRRRHHRSSQKTRLVIVLGALVAIESALLFAAYVRMSMADHENTQLVAAERKQTAELEALRPQVEKLREEIAALAEARLPDLQRLEFDKVIPIDKDYVKNIVFSVAGKGDQKQYEYKLVVHNGTLSLLHPRVDILFFDRVGIQVGLSRIGVQKDGTDTLDMIDRGEIRSFSSHLDLTDNGQPEYFRLRIVK
jgi:cell division protein FtsB